MASPNQPARFSSLFAMVLTTSGVAIGLGNIWRFPYMMAEHGGAVFLLVYLAIVFFLGIPTLMAEWALGRHTRSGPAGAFKSIGMPFAPLWSALLIITILMASSYYGVILAQVLGTSIAYSVTLVSPDSTNLIDWLTQNSWATFLFVCLTIGTCCGALYFGITTGIERLSKIILPFCLVLFVILIVRSLSLPGAIDGLKIYLAPKAENFRPETGLAALGQAFFSIGLGGTMMVVYGSYMRQRDSIPIAAIGTALADIMAALLAGLIVIPAVIALGVELSAGPSLLFVVMPEVFEKMPIGSVFGLLFFGSVFLIAMLSLIAAFEVLVDSGSRLLGFSRGQALVVILVLQIALSIPAIMIPSYIGLSDMIWGSTMHPFGSAIAIIALLWCGGRSKALAEIKGEGTLPFAAFLYYWLRYVVPFVILFILIYGWKDQLLELWRSL